MDIHSHISGACMLARGTFTPSLPLPSSARWPCTIACTRRLCSPTSQPKPGFLYLLLLPILLFILLLFYSPSFSSLSFSSSISSSPSFSSYLPSHCIHPPPSPPPSLSSSSSSFNLPSHCIPLPPILPSSSPLLLLFLLPLLLLPLLPLLLLPLLPLLLLPSPPPPPLPLLLLLPPPPPTFLPITSTLWLGNIYHYNYGSKKCSIPNIYISSLGGSGIYFWGFAGYMQRYRACTRILLRLNSTRGCMLV